MSEETIIRILKDVARMPIPDDDQGYYCPLCYATGLDKQFSEIDDVKHESDCAVLLARKELRERGTPMKVCKVTGERVWGKDAEGKHWGTFQIYTLAIDNDDALSTWAGSERRNVQVTYVRDLLSEEGGILQAEGAK